MINVHAINIHCFFEFLFVYYVGNDMILKGVDEKWKTDRTFHGNTLENS